jgi:phosphoglycolate phosphatase
MTPRPTVLLFDIDGTLLSSSGAGRRAMERAFEQLTGVRDALSFGFDGMTDRAIARRGLGVAGKAATDQAIDAVLEAYLANLPAELEAPGDYHVYPGVREVLAATVGRPALATGLGTGNVQRGAHLKLGRLGLDGFFAFGGFGSDHEDRPSIIRTGAARGAAHLGLSRSACRVVVIGDTPKDVDAARAANAECVAVATGRFSPAELQAAGAHHAFVNLAEPGVLEAILGR